MDMARILDPGPNYQGLHRELIRKDLLTPILPLFKPNGPLQLEADGRIRYVDIGIEVNSPWVHPVPAQDRNCGLWHFIMFERYGILPSPCFECWKTVVAPRTLKELMALMDLQYQYKHPCKCGIEIREYVPRLYGGYFYSNSLDDGIANYKNIRKMVSEAISPDVPVILKRGCTEFEMKFGPSNQWILQPGQLELEAEITALIDYGGMEMWNQPAICQPYIMSTWIRWAYKNADETYIEFNGGVPLFPGVVHYEDVDTSKLKKITFEIVRPA